ncbi:galactose oxidase/kelch repeat superfamily protein [Artemisia annua]|uniref:Galactose oxidase/kelch repeat superfamily protein n=1 Tax=Artemisia annua TaxID=35608 RepID=A0A2U1MGR7_ARTAN|nr:galactose oxidase/kelch repeat superfamily protein [Artemisia annua]
MDLIPGLPDDIGFECLARVPYTHFPNATFVCRGWKSELGLPAFQHHRKHAGLSQRVIIMVQSKVDPARKYGLRKYSAAPVYRLTVFEPGRVGGPGCRPYPGSQTGYRFFVKCFLSATWRRGPDMPGCTRSFFGCASDNVGKVFVAGGHDNEKNALRSGWVYDVADDVWAPLPDMVEERDECKGVFHRGRFYVIGGYNTLMQGQFGKSAECFDLSTWRWETMDGLLGDDTCPRTCVAGGDGVMYMYQDGAVVALDHSFRMRLPSDMDSVPCLIECDGRLLAVGSVGFGGRHGVYELDLKRSTWTKVEVPEEYSGHVQSGCCLEL